MTVSEVVATLARREVAEISADGMAELDRRSAKIEQGELTVSNDDVQWLKTWGTPDHKPWPNDR